MLQPTPVGGVGWLAGAAHGLRAEIDRVRLPGVDVLKDRLACAVGHSQCYGMVRQGLRLDLDRLQPGGFRRAGYVLVDQFHSLQLHRETGFFQPAYRTERDQEFQVAVIRLGYRQSGAALAARAGKTTETAQRKPPFAPGLRDARRQEIEIELRLHGTTLSFGVER